MRDRRLRVIGGSLDGGTVPAFDPDGRLVTFITRGTTGEVWVRDADEARFLPGASVEDGYIAITRPPDDDEERVA
jgi:hypothetical protein